MLVGLQGQVQKIPIQTWYFFPFIFRFLTVTILA